MSKMLRKMEEETRRGNYSHRERLREISSKFLKATEVSAQEALTIHKSQGGTFPNVVVHLKPGITRSQLYVACSRATSASGLFLAGRIAQWAIYSTKTKTSY